MWYEEVKIRLPTNILYSHHLLFTFYHISCDINKKRENGVENCVGYAWLPLLHKGKLNVEMQTIPVASHLPPGYLSVHPFGLGKGVSKEHICIEILLKQNLIPLRFYNNFPHMH